MIPSKTKLEQLKRDIINTKRAIMIMWCDALTRTENLIITIKERKDAAEAAYRARQ